MLNSYELSIPKLPGFDMGEWLKDQASIVQNLAQRANRVSPPQSMDQLQTLPFDAADICVKNVFWFLGILSLMYIQLAGCTHTYKWNM